MRTAEFFAGRRSRRSERGAILVHVAVALAGLTAFSVLVVDLGAVWVARRQAQNVADAAAYSAAVALAYGDPSDTSAATDSAVAIAGAHTVWGQTVALAGGDVIYVPCPPGLDPLPPQCVRVNIDGAGTPLPIYFSRLAGGTASAVRATATAAVVAANTTNCLAPWAIVDRWTDAVDVDAPIDVGTWTSEDRYERYLPTPPPTLQPPPFDEYIPPSSGSPGTGYVVSNDVGVQVQVDLIDPDDIAVDHRRARQLVPDARSAERIGHSRPGGLRREHRVLPQRAVRRRRHGRSRALFRRGHLEWRRCADCAGSWRLLGRHVDPRVKLQREPTRGSVGAAQPGLHRTDSWSIHHRKHHRWWS